MKGFILKGAEIYPAPSTVREGDWGVVLPSGGVLTNRPPHEGGKVIDPEPYEGGYGLLFYGLEKEAIALKHLPSGEVFPINSYVPSYDSDGVEGILHHYLDGLGGEAWVVVDGIFAALRSRDFGIIRAMKVVYRLLGGDDFINQVIEHPAAYGGGGWNTFVYVFTIPRRVGAGISASATTRWWLGMLTRWVRGQRAYRVIK